MSASKDSTDHPSQLQGSFSALVECLRKSFRLKGTVSIPKNIIAPFRKPFRPTDSSLLRDLAKVLENGRPHKNLVRLDSHSFYSIVSIVLHFPYSIVQSKLLYLFMVGWLSIYTPESGLLDQDTVRQYKNEGIFASVLSSIHGADLTPTEVKEQGDYVGRKLSSCVLRHLVSREKEAQLRWTLAQFLSVLVRFSSAARDQIVEMAECPLLTMIVELDKSHFLRILVADVIREMLYKGAERLVFGKSSASRKIVENFPLSATGDSKWMSEVVEYFSQIDVARAFVEEPERIFIVQSLECDGHKFFASPSPFVATVTSEISFLVPRGADTGMITLVSVPVTENATINCIASESESSTILEIRYPGDEGDRFANGSRSAMNSLTITFCDEEGVEGFTQSIQELRRTRASGRAHSALATPRKQSFAIINISSTSGDENHNEGHTLNAVTTSEVDASSPLRDLSLRNRQTGDSAAGLLLQTQTAMIVSHLEVVDGEDTAALRKAPDSRQLIERLRASQQEETDSPPKTRPSSRRSLLLRSSPKVDSAEGVTKRKQPTHHSAAAHGSPQGAAPASSESESKRKRPAEPTSSSLSNQAKKRSKAADNTKLASGNTKTQLSGHKKETLKDTMARLIGAGEDASKASTGAAQTGLKRKSKKESTASRSERTQKPSKSVSDGVGFDLPPSDADDTRPPKKAKTKSNKPPANATAKGPAEMKKSALRVAASPKSRKKDNDKPKTKKSPEEKTQLTAASTRARRAAKTPKYIENSDESGDDVAHEEAGAEEDIGDNHKDDNGEETAEDSLPISKEILETAAKASQLEFITHVKSQLQGMVERESTDDEAVSRDELPPQDPAGEQTTLKDEPPVQVPTEMQEQTASRMDTLGPKVGAKWTVLETNPSELLSAAADESLPRYDSPVQKSDNRIALAKEPPTPNPTERQIPAKKKLTEHVSTRQKATPQRNVKRLSENPIPPASEKLLRKTPIVHFGPQGPANQAVSSKPTQKVVTFRTATNKSYVQPPAPRLDDDEPLEVSDQPAQQPSPEPQDPTSRADDTERAAHSAPAEERYELPPPGEHVDDTHVEYFDELVQHPSSERRVKSPEIQETQPRSSRDADHTGNELVGTEAEDGESLVEISIVTDDKSYDQEASEYVVSEAEEEASLESPPAPESQLSRKPDASIRRAETPLLDDDVPGRGYQRVNEPLVSRHSTRQSIGIGAILDEGYPTAQKVINAQKLRPARQPAAVDQTSRASALSTELPSITPILKRSDILEPANRADTREEARRTGTASVVLSMSPRQRTSVNKSSDYSIALQSGQERAQHAFRYSIPISERSLLAGETSAVKPRTQTDSRAHSTKESTTMTAISLSSKPGRAMAPPPLPMTLATRVSRKPVPLRKSWPESHVERTTRGVEVVPKEQVTSINSGPVRVKKRLTLPLAADEQNQEPNFPPATPASFSARLDLHADLAVHQGCNDKDWRTEYDGLRFGNGSMTLVNEEDSGLEERSGIRTRPAGRRQRSDSGDRSTAASPSRTSRGKEYAGNKDVLMAGPLTARGSQRGLLSAIVNITNDVLFRFGEEEDAINAKVDQYARGGRAIIETLTDTWGQRLEHEHKILLDGLKAEEELLSAASGLLTEKQSGGAWREAIADDGLAGKVQKKGARLVKQIERLTQ